MARFLMFSNMICLHKAFRLKVEQESGYANLACYFKYTGDTAELAKEKSKQITQDCIVFDKFSDILRNLRLCHYVDIRRIKREHLIMALNP